MRFVTWNLWALGKDWRRDEKRIPGMATVLAALRPDVVAVQEVCNGELFRDLAQRAVLTPYSRLPWFDDDDADPGELAIEPGGHGYGVGLMWNSATMRPSPSTRVGGDELWHGLIQASFRHEPTGSEAVFGSYHAPALHRGLRTDEANAVAFRFSQHRTPHAVLIGADWNCVGESEVLDPDPFASQAWAADNIRHCEWDSDQNGRPTRWWADRGASRALHAGGLADAYALHAMRGIGVPAWAATVGHHPKDSAAPRRVDGVRANRRAARAVVAHTVVTPEWPDLGADLDELSDHRPVVVDLEPDLLPMAPPRA